jgi:hypothetical protein
MLQYEILELQLNFSLTVKIRNCSGESHNGNGIFHVKPTLLQCHSTDYEIFTILRLAEIDRNMYCRCAVGKYLFFLFFLFIFRQNFCGNINTTFQDFAAFENHHILLYHDYLKQFYSLLKYFIVFNMILKIYFR